LLQTLLNPQAPELALGERSASREEEKHRRRRMPQADLAKHGKERGGVDAGVEEDRRVAHGRVPEQHLRRAPAGREIELAVGEQRVSAYGADVLEIRIDDER